MARKSIARTAADITLSGAKVAKNVADAAESGLDKLPAPSPNPMTNLLIADLAMRGGERLVRLAVERAMLGMKYSDEKASKLVKGRSLVQTLVGTTAMRIATKSVPGALLVGGGLLAKTLYDRRKSAAAARADGEAETKK
jgi:hypothetical protein